MPQRRAACYLCRPVAQDAGLVDLDEMSIQDARLRDVPRDPAVVSAAVERAREALVDARGRGDLGEQQHLLGYLGNACRLLGRTDDAIAWLTESLSLARATGDARRGLAAVIRLGEVYRCRNDYGKAEALFREALDRTQAASELESLADFALQHLGKCLLDQGESAEAVECLERALALRQAKANPQLIASTERALAHARSARAAP